MKRILISFILFFSLTNAVFGQVGEYHLKTILHYNHDGHFHCTDHQAWVHYSISPDNGGGSSRELLYDYASLPDGDHTRIHEINYSANRDLTEIEFWGERYHNGRCRSGSHHPGGRSLFNIGCYQIQDDAYENAMWGESVTVTNTPLLTILPRVGGDDSLPTEDNITLYSHTGFKSSEYNWQYSINNGNSWIALPDYNGLSSITLNAEDIFNGNAINHHGETIIFRQVACNYESNNSSPYIIRLSAPHILSEQTQTALTSCYDSHDGAVRIFFDRPLKTGETISLTSSNPNFPSGDFTNITQFESDNSIFITGLDAGNYAIEFIGFYNGTSTSIIGEGHSTTFEINKPSPVEFIIPEEDVDNVWCYGGSDGTITITAQGGTGTYEYQLDNGTWLAFTNGDTHTITGLAPETYRIKVRDTNACIAKEQTLVNGEIALGAIIEQEITIIQPDAPVAVAFVNSVEPTAYGFSNGSIQVQITGGTPLADGTYNYSCIYTDANGVSSSWSSFQGDFYSGNDGWFLTITNALAGTYALTIKDANFSSATHTLGCTNHSRNGGFIYTLNQPPLLELSVVNTTAISCNDSNTFNNPWSDGVLTATATGGVPFDPLINGQYEYIYIWKKKDASGVYQTIAGETGNVLSNLSDGDYAVNVRDANGITVGTHFNNVVTAVDVPIPLHQPDLLQVVLTKTDVFCNQGDDGSITATITGGTGNYDITWSNDVIDTTTISNLVAGTYSVAVADGKGCQAEATITINEPESPLNISYTSFSPTFSGATNGWIEATITGGTPLDSGAYTYVWKDSNGTDLSSQVIESINATSFVIRLPNLGAGVYTLTIEDKNYPLATSSSNCTITASTQELFDPEPLEAEIQIYTPISCNSANTYNDPYSDGALEVIASGGVHLQPSDNGGLWYYYTWKKETSPGVWEVLPAQTTNIATGLAAGNYAVNIEDANGIILGVYVNNVLSQTTDVTFPFEEPPLLALTIEKQDVYCFGGNDGWANLSITGGIAPYDILWDNGDTTAQTSNLPQGTYTVAVTDHYGCQVQGSISIEQPSGPPEINYTAFATPATGGASDGWIEAQITGGTSATDGSYTYSWYNAIGVLLNTQTTTSIVNGVFQIRLNNVPKGTYYLTIEDANYSLASTENGCTVIADEFKLYDPIEATIEILTPISCHADNEFNNPFSDGELLVTVTGGLPFDTGQPYIYHWKKENSNGIFEDINQNSNTATGLSVGNYALNVEDSRGIIIGTYESLTLLEAADVPFFFEQPELLEASLTATAVSCGAGNDGTATVSITGGTPPYSIAWSNGAVGTATITDLFAGNYVVYITDHRGCQATGQITIAQPGGINVAITEQTNPTCFQGNDGVISIAVSGGVTPYTSYSWNTGATTTTIDNLEAGTYVFELIDANDCVSYTEVVLEDPDEITIDLGEDKTLCNDQTIDLDGSISDPNATYVWTSDNGFSATTAQVAVSEAGTYQVTATSSLGCTASDEITVSFLNMDIDAEFLLSSQAYLNEDVILFNVSNPLGEFSEWVIPSNVTIIAQEETYITLHFPEVGAYEIGLISRQGDCSQEIYKNIVVEQSSGLPSAGDTNNPFIEAFTVTPNPNDGHFLVLVKLAESSPIALRIYNHLGSLVYTQPTVDTAIEYTLPIDLSLSSGAYIIVLETAEETQIKRLIRF